MHRAGRPELQAVLDSLAGKGLLTRLPERPAGMHRSLRRSRWKQPYSSVSGNCSRHAPRSRAWPSVTGPSPAKPTRASWWRSYPAAGPPRSTGTARSQRRVPGAGAEPAALRGLLPDPDPCELELLSRRVTVRVSMTSRRCLGPAVIARRRAEISAGEQARVSGEVPVHLLLVDDQLAVLPLGHDQPLVGGLVIVNACPLLDALSALFGKTWREAVAFISGSGTAVPFGGPAGVFELLRRRPTLSAPPSPV